jgi:NAD(P)H-hydrate epimerase
MATELTQDSMRQLVPERPPAGHKGTFGHVLIIASSRGYTGTARLAAESAGRSGVGLVTVAVPGSLLDVVATTLFESMSMPLPSTDAGTFAKEAVAPALEAAKSRDAVVLGPGISQQEETRQFVLDFVRQCPVPTLIDADGLNCISHSTSVIQECQIPLVLTPHPGEMARLANCSTSDVQTDRERTARRFAEGHGCVVVLKGMKTVVAAPDGSCCINPTGNAGLATGGTGDVLAGFIGGLLAQKMAAYDAARLGVFLMGLAGDIAARKYTQHGMIARDAIECIPAAWKELGGSP